MAASMKTISCYGCGEDISGSKTRYNMFSSCFKSMAVWKRLVLERLNELNIELDIGELLHDKDGTVGKIHSKWHIRN